MMRMRLIDENENDRLNDPCDEEERLTQIKALFIDIFIQR